MWFKYIQRFLQNKLDCFQNNYKNYLFILNHISQLLELWLNISKQAVLSLWSGEQVETEKIKHPLGKWRKSGHNENIPKKQTTTDREYYYHIFMWQFYLSRYFRLNITFECISLKFGQLYHCYFGNLSITSFSNTLSQSFQYCGIHSNMINYPQYQNIDLTVSLRPHVFYNIKMSYSVIDPDNIISYPTRVPVE